MKIWQLMQTLSRKQKNANCQLEMVTFPLLIVRFFFSKSIMLKLLWDEKLCKFHENPTKNTDFIA